MYTPVMKPKPGELVVLVEVPPGFVDDLPLEDHQAINEIVGKPIMKRAHDLGRHQIHQGPGLIPTPMGIESISATMALKAFVAPG